jgi:ABC-type enterochelin transport system permease subunit
MAGTIASVVFVAGLVAITIGAWWISPAAGLIVGGVLAVIASWLARKGDGPTRPSA